MKITIEQRIFELQRKLSNVSAQYDAQLTVIKNEIEQEICMLSMALNSPVEFSCVSEITCPEPLWINPETIPSKPNIKEEPVWPKEELESIPVV